MEFTVPPDNLYTAHSYRSGTNVTMRGYLAGIAAEAMALLGKLTGRVLDIG